MNRITFAESRSRRKAEIAAFALLAMVAMVAMVSSAGWVGIIEFIALGAFGAFGAISSFIPQVWSARLLSVFRRARRWRRVVTDVSDEIRRQGDTIHVGEVVSSVTVRDYAKGSDLEAPEIQTDYDNTFKIDQGKYFNIAVNDIDRVQSQPSLLPRFTSEAAYQLALGFDSFVRGLYIGGASTKVDSFEHTAPTGKSKASAAANSVRKQRAVITGILTGGIGAYTNEAAYTAACTKLANDLFFLQRILLERDWPFPSESTGGQGGEGSGPGIFAICNTKTYEALTWYLLKITNGSGALQDATVRGGFIKQIFGLDLVPDPGMPNTDAGADSVGKLQIAIGVEGGIYTAEQIRQTEAYRPEKRFQDAVKGLSVYGGKRVDATKLFAVVQGAGNKVGVADHSDTT